METTTITPKQERQRKFLAVLPALVLPFISFFFWSLGGGQKTEAQSKQQETGLNLRLPGAHLDEKKTLDKMSYYEQAATDSEKYRKGMKDDPYREVAAADTEIITPDSLLSLHDFSRHTGGSTNGRAYRDPNEEKVYKKLDELNAALERSATPAHTPANALTGFQTSSNTAATTPENLTKLLQQQGANGDADPELQQLNGMLEKLMDIQHPELVQEKIRQSSEQKRGQVFAIGNVVPETPVSLLETSGNYAPAVDSYRQLQPQNGFFSLDEPTGNGKQEPAVAAVIHETQTLVNGSTVKLRLTEPVFINGIEVPKDQFVYGLATLSGERLSVHINSIRYHNAVLPVALSVFDMDGLDGIYIPGAIARDVAKQSADRAVQNIGFTTLNPTLEVQAASAGIEAAKTLFSKKVKLIKVSVKAGYQVLLRDDKQQRAGQ